MTEREYVTETSRTRLMVLTVRLDRPNPLTITHFTWRSARPLHPVREIQLDLMEAKTKIGSPIAGWVPTVTAVWNGTDESQIDFEGCGEAADGVDAIEKAKELKPDLILLDSAMPRMNGVEAASVLKGLMPRVPIVLFTLYNEMLGKSLTPTIGIDAVFSKLDGGWKLVDCVRSLLQAA